MTPKFDLFSKGMPSAANQSSAGFQGMASARHGQKEERARHAALIEQLREALKPYALSSADQKKLNSLAQSAEGEFFWREVLSLGQEFKRQQQPDKAGTVFAFVAQSSPEAFRDPANHELNAILGQGHVGMRSEFLVSSFVQNATDYRTIVPMLAGSIVGQSLSAATMGRLASARSATFLTRGLGARSFAGFVGLTAEIPVFAFANRALSGSTSPVGDDLARAALTLSALKAFGGAGNRVVGSRFFAPAGATNSAVRTIVPQASMFFGLMAAHKLEERAGLRPHVDGATTVTDTLASMVSLGVGAHLGHQFLGPKFAAFQKEMALRVDSAAKAPQSETPSFLAEGFGKGGKTEALVGPNSLPTARKPSSWIRNPALAPLWAMMSTGGIGGPPGGKSSASGEAGAGDRLADRNHKESLHYHGLDLEMETTSSGPQAQLARSAEFMRDALLDILTNGEEDGAMLEGKVAEQLRGDANFRAMANRTGNKIKARFDAEARSILELTVFTPAGLKMGIKDPALDLVSEAPPEFQPERTSGIRTASTQVEPPAEVARENVSVAPETEERDCGLLVTLGNSALEPAESPSPLVEEVVSPLISLPSATQRNQRETPRFRPEGTEVYHYQFAIAKEIEALAQAGKEWERVWWEAKELYDRLNRKVVGTGAMYAERNMAGANLNFILASRQRGFSSKQIEDLLIYFKIALNGDLSQKEVYERRKTMTGESWKRAFEIAAASAPTEEENSQEEKPFTAPPAVRPVEKPEQLALKKLEFLAQGKPAWRGIYFEVQTIYERLFSAEALGSAELEPAREEFPDVLFTLIDIIEEDGRVTPPKAMRYLEAFEKAMKGVMSWEEFGTFDYTTSTPPPASAAPARELSPAIEPAESGEIEVADAPPAAPRKGVPTRESLQKFDPVSEMSDLQEAIWNTLLDAPGEMQGRDVVEALPEREENFKTIYRNLARMAQRGWLSVRSEPHPTVSTFPDYKFYSIPETVRLTIGLTPGQRTVMEFFLKAERTEFLAARVVDQVAGERASVSEGRGIYRILDALRTKGLLASRNVPNAREGMPALRYYRLPEVESGSELQAFVLPEHVAAKVKDAPLQELVYRILSRSGGEMQVNAVTEAVRASGESEGKPQSTSLALRVLEKKGLLTSRSAPNPLKGLVALRFYSLPAAAEKADDASRFHYSTWDNVRQQADRLRQSDVEGRFEGRRLEQARDALDLVFKFEKDLAPEQGELLLRAFEGDLASGNSFPSVRPLLDKMLPFKKILHKLKRLNDRGDPWREVSSEAGKRFNTLFHPIVGNAKREAGVRALKEILSAVGQVAPADVLNLLRSGQIEAKMEEAPASPVPPRPILASEPPPPAPVMLPAHFAKNWELTVQPILERCRELFQDPRLSRAMGVLKLGELLITEIHKSHFDKNGKATTQSQFEWSQSLSEYLNQALVQEKTVLPLIEDQMIELMQDIMTNRFGAEVGSVAAENLRGQRLGRRKADTIHAVVSELSVEAPAGIEAEAENVETTETISMAESKPVEDAPQEIPASVSVAPKPVTLNPPKPAPVQDVIELSPEPGHRQGLFGLGRAFSFFAVPTSTHPEGKEFEASLILPNLHRLTFKVLVQSSGSLKVNSETGKGLSYPGGREYPIQVEKVEGYDGLVRIDLGKGRAPFDLQITPVRDRSNNIQRLMLAPLQAPYSGSLQPFFAVSAPRSIHTQVLHHDLLVTGSRKGEYRTRYGFYLSNGDTMELGLNYALHGSGKFRVTSAHLNRLGLDPEKPLELDVLKGSGSGGKNRIVIGHKDAGFLLEMDTDIPSISAGGAIPIFKNFQVKNAPLPVWVRLESMPDAGAEKSIPQKDDLGGSERISSVPPSHPTAYDEIRDLSMQAMGGDSDAIAGLGRIGAKDQLALQELTELFDIAQSEGATAEDLGGVEPVEYRRQVLRAIGEASKENPRGLIHLTALHSAGILSSLEPLFAVADSESPRSQEARQYLFGQSEFGQVQVLAGMIGAAKDAQTPSWKEAVNRHLKAYYLGDVKGGRGIHYRMMRELAVLKTVQGLAALGHAEAREALRSWNDFREYKNQLAKGADSTGILETLREVAKVNPRAAKFLRDLESGAEQSPIPPVPPSAPAAVSEREVSSPVPFVSEETLVSEPAEQPAEPLSQAAEEAKRAMANAHSLSLKKVFRGDLFKQMAVLAKNLSAAEKRELLEQWTPHLIAALKDNHQKKITLYFDAIDALDHDLEPDTHEWLVSQLKPWEARVPRNMEAAIRGILTGVRTEVYIRVGSSSEEIIPIRTDLILSRTEGESREIAAFKDLLDQIHKTQQNKQDPLYLKLNSIGTTLNSADLHRMAKEATEELVVAAQQAFLPQNLEGYAPKYPFQSKIAVLANVLFRIFRAMTSGDDAAYILTLLGEPNLKRFRIDWLNAIR